MKTTVVKVIRNLVVSVMKGQKSKKIAHKNDRRKKDKRNHWSKEYW